MPDESAIPKTALDVFEPEGERIHPYDLYEILKDSLKENAEMLKQMADSAEDHWKRLWADKGIRGHEAYIRDVAPLRAMALAAEEPHAY